MQEYWTRFKRREVGRKLKRRNMASFAFYLFYFIFFLIFFLGAFCLFMQSWKVRAFLCVLTWLKWPSYILMHVTLATKRAESWDHISFAFVWCLPWFYALQILVHSHRCVWRSHPINTLNGVSKGSNLGWTAYLYIPTGKEIICMHASLTSNNLYGSF